ncbi:MAG: PilZ domain-containing protein [Terriglobales bacterium]
MHTNAGCERQQSCRVRVYRTDGSNRMYEAHCSDVNEKGLRVHVPATFVVGEVVALVFLAGGDDRKRRRLARVLYRTSDHYGLYFLSRAG